MKQDYKEVLAGVVLLIILAGILLGVHLKAALPQKTTDFILYASFSNADGVMKGTPVRLGGIRVGEVTNETLAGEYRVRVEMSFKEKLELSADTSAVIETDGLLGPKHIELVPGGEEEVLNNKDELAYTQDALLLNALMEKVNQHMRTKKNLEAPDDEGHATHVDEQTVYKQSNAVFEGGNGQ